MPSVLTSTAGYSKVLFSMENAQIMLEMAAKCSNYAKNSGLCFLFWIILFQADYAKNYASILYQCPVADTTRASKLQFFCSGSFFFFFFFVTQVRQVQVVFLRTLRNAATRLPDASLGVHLRRWCVEETG